MCNFGTFKQWNFELLASPLHSSWIDLALPDENDRTGNGKTFVPLCGKAEARNARNPVQIRAATSGPGRIDESYVSSAKGKSQTLHRLHLRFRPDTRLDRYQLDRYQVHANRPMHRKWNASNGENKRYICRSTHVVFDACNGTKRQGRKTRRPKNEIAE